MPLHHSASAGALNTFQYPIGARRNSNTPILDYTPSSILSYYTILFYIEHTFILSSIWGQVQAATLTGPLLTTSPLTPIPRFANTTRILLNLGSPRYSNTNTTTSRYNYTPSLSSTKLTIMLPSSSSNGGSGNNTLSTPCTSSLNNKSPFAQPRIAQICTLKEFL